MNRYSYTLSGTLLKIYEEGKLLAEIEDVKDNADMIFKDVVYELRGVLIY